MAEFVLDIFLKRVACALFVTLSVVFVSACERDASWHLESHESEEYSFSRFMDNINSFPYTADPSKISRVKEGFHRLAVGMRKDEVRNIVGAPDSAMIHYKFAKGNQESLYSTWGYYLKRHERNLAKDDLDVMVTLYFNLDEELYFAFPDNVAGLTPLGKPQPIE
jgi:hypothetical protein